MWRKVQVGGAVVGLRLATRSGTVRPITPVEPDDTHVATVTLGSLGNGARGGRSELWTFPLSDLASFAESFAFGRALARGFVRRDRAFSHNLRLVEFRARLRAISEQLRARGKADAIVNRAPESYRAYATHLQRIDPASHVAPPSSGAGARLRFQPAWTAAVPSIDLKATFLTGAGLLVGSAREVYCIERKTGATSGGRCSPCGLWRASTPMERFACTTWRQATFGGH
ncbi:MAG: hypothetical protein U0414_25520 [Polyangiaceae bacterium]